jgi:P27 family predicted phage terminase small subunit
MLREMKLACRPDDMAIERYVVQFCRWRECEAFLGENGITREDGRPHRQVAECHALAAALQRFEDRFGFSPGARTRLIINPDERKAMPDTARKRDVHIG